MLGFDAASIVQSIGDSFNTGSELQEVLIHICNQIVILYLNFVFLLLFITNFS